ncbi:streptogramin lyase [Sphingomonas zeicaulis]|uniref:DUF6438 domain-containing protein n=1 Tax=Sphingomonas zeicaulis TaxID=1632740 RepID=UPI003D232EEC
MIHTSFRSRALAPAVALVGALALGGCAAESSGVGPTPAPAAGETIAVSVGPCFGFCPVYQVSIAPDGAVTFTGERHTEVIGERKATAGAATYEAVAHDLAPFRPADGTTARVDCEAAITDTSTYTITWTDASGRQTVATHQSRCSGGPGKALDAVLGRLPEQLGIAGWAKQVTRPGVSRG